MGSFTANSVALQVPEIALVQLPFFFASRAQRDCVLDNHLQKPVSEALAKKDLVFMNWGEVGSVHIPGKKAYATHQDLFVKDMVSLPLFQRAEAGAYTKRESRLTRRSRIWRRREVALAPEGRSGC